VATATGWFPDDIGNRLTVPQFLKLHEQWAKYPPVHVCMALSLGLGKDRPKQQRVDENPGEFLSMIGAFPGGVRR
jgi:hypothetical protein